jgi:tripartite-type tricarboxylate transporter receptor subunit TctC
MMLTPKNLARKTIQNLFVVFVLGLSFQAMAEFPDRAIKFIVPFPPGAGTDASARLLSNALSTQIKQPIVVENKAGGGGSIGAQAVIDAPADGYTLFFATTGTLAFNPYLYSKLRYNPLTDFTPIAGVASFPNVLVVSPSLPVKTVSEFIALAKSKPGQLTYGSSGTGSSSHLAVILLESLTDSSFTHVPYKGSTPAITDLISSRIDFMIDNITTHSALAKQGKVIALGLTGSSTSNMLPGALPLSKLGVPGYDMVLWYGILGPAGVSNEVVNFLSENIKSVVNNAKFKAAMEGIGNDSMYMTPKEFDGFIKSEHRKWGDVIKRSGVKPE